MGWRGGVGLGEGVLGWLVCTCGGSLRSSAISHPRRPQPKVAHTPTKAGSAGCVCCVCACVCVIVSARKRVKRRTLECGPKLCFYVEVSQRRDNVKLERLTLLSCSLDMRVVVTDMCMYVCERVCVCLHPSLYTLYA